MLGRVGSIVRLVGLTGLTVGATTGGLLASRFGYLLPFAVAATLFGTAAVLCAARVGVLEMAPSAS